MKKKLSFFSKLLVLINILAVVGIITAYASTYVNPSDFWLLAFFGLAYPFLLLLNVLFAFYWALRKRKLFLLSFVAIIIGANHLSHFIQFNPSQTPTEGNSTFKIMSYNVRLFDLYDWSENKNTRNNIFKLLTEEDADIMCFQEFFYSDRKDYFATRDTLLKFHRVQYSHEQYTHLVKKVHHFGIATFSAYPIVHKGVIEFTNDANNVCIYSDIKIKNDTIRVYNAHLASIRFGKEDYEFIEGLGNNNDEDIEQGSRRIVRQLKSAFIKRAEQVQQITAHIAESPYPIIVCGDFNDTPVSYCYREFTRHLTDAFVESGNGIGSTYNGKFPSFRIDYILYSKGVNAYQFKTLPDKLSDHHPIVANIELLGKREH